MTGTIMGFVSEYANANNPIAGATVTISSKGLTKTTGSDGRFEFTDLEPGTYSISVSANTYQVTTKQVTVYAGQKANCDFQLEKASANVEISPLTLTFGQNVDQLSFSIMNSGNQSLHYSISNVPDYVEVSPASGTAMSKSSQVVTVRIKDRSSITTARNAQLKVNVGNDSYVVSISVEAYTDTSSDITIEPKSLTFGKDTELLTFTMTSGHTQEQEYKIDSDLDILTINPASGKLSAHGKVEVSVKVKERKKITEDYIGTLTITVGHNTYQVSVNVPKYDETVNVDIQPKTLTFNKDTERLSFKITSKNTKDFTYNISSDLSPLAITPTIGTLPAQGSVEVSVSVKDRKTIIVDRTGTININIGETAYAVQVKIDKYDEAVNADIQPASLNFDKDTDRLSFKITSKNIIDFAYNISSNLDFLTISPTNGTLPAQGSVEVNVSVKNRKSITVDQTGTLTVNIGGSAYSIPVSVDKCEDNSSQGGGDGGIVVPSGLYAYFTFENNTKDQTDTGITATGIGTSFVDSYDGTKALNIPANASCMLSIPNGLVDQREMSISFWVKDLYDGHVFHAIRNTDYRPYAFLLAVENGMLKFVPDPYAIQYQYPNQPTFTHGSLSGWHMITLVSDYSKSSYNVTTTLLYVDGDHIDTSTASVSSGGNSYLGYENCTKVIIGGEMMTTDNYGPKLGAPRITMDNLRVYKNRRLSASEIKTIYNAEKK